MEFSAIISQLFGGFWYLIPLVVIVAIIGSPWFKGLMGEFFVNLSVRFLLDKNQYHIDQKCDAADRERNHSN
jgi:hypothetical protein